MKHCCSELHKPLIFQLPVLREMFPASGWSGPSCPKYKVGYTSLEQNLQSGMLEESRRGSEDKLSGVHGFTTMQR